MMLTLLAATVALDTEAPPRVITTSAGFALVLDTATAKANDDDTMFAVTVG